MKFEKKNHFVEDEINTITEGLKSFNYEKVEDDFEPFMITVKNNDQVIAGAQCATVWNWMWLMSLWVKEDKRKKGLGTQIMSEIEIEAKQRKCIGIHFDTFEFQALGFYQKLGYQIFGVIDDHPTHSQHPFRGKI